MDINRFPRLIPARELRAVHVLGEWHVVLPETEPATRLAILGTEPTLSVADALRRSDAVRSACCADCSHDAHYPHACEARAGSDVCGCAPDADPAMRRDGSIDHGDTP